MVNVENIPTWLPVVALALIDDEGRLLLQERPSGKHHGGLWEFPGGKVEAGESPRDSLVREIEEELGLHLDPHQFVPSGFAEESQQSRIVLFLYSTRQNAGVPVPREGQRVGWFTPASAQDLPLAPMDRRLLAQLDMGPALKKPHKSD
ncbi:(deoxy)nucleoside triphosphate pyrophosphohydrolase [Erythrobacter sp. EC-HK427]|uniref:(deoxy)nucleoside triphosphate pyrophosphohydrolase n=1 Tax=Erythrobacter sp. EC-HK427 TaxID=2038396 RepID=UPI0012553CB8|nr:(deoxy)nucleoside triphosphate pyrophosphohydrolase [Erythrobacter sp. EC-HK427]VVT17463.1 CTP pyrophosphohydrolase [Erythrobacter sp. EC-HK427]